MAALPDDVTDPNLSGLLTRYMPASNPAWSRPTRPVGSTRRTCSAPNRPTSGAITLKADLARQLGDWEQVAALQEEALGKATLSKSPNP
jgi:hypothetical protein